MSWREDLGKTSFTINGQSVQVVGGSYKGVPFRTVDSEAHIGRRNVVNEYPQRDVPYVDDLGRRARRFKVDAYVIGDDYLAQRDQLMEALESYGPGELNHPRWGALQVSVDGEATVKESPREGGMAHFSITFVEHGANTFPKAQDDTVMAVETAANDADEAFELCFADEFSVEGASVLAAQALDGVGAIKGLTAQVGDVLAMARRVTDITALGGIVGLVGGLTGNLAALIRTPVVLVQGLRSVFAQLVQNLLRPLSAFAELQAVFFGNTRSPAVALAGSTRARSLANDTARADLTRRMALSNQARILAVAITQTSNTKGVTSRDQAVVLRNALVAQIDTELEMNDPPLAVARTLTALRAAVVRDVAARAELLSTRSTYTPQAVLPALVLAHRVYQDATRYEELVARNSVPHPAFMPARALEVLV